LYKIAAPPNPQFLSAFRDLSPKAQAHFRVELQTKVKPVLQKQVDATFGRDPGPVKYPIEWETDKQRKAFFASDRFGGGIPTKRSDQLKDSWVVVISTQMRTNLITLRNPKSYAQFVYPGSRQQRFHKRTGWGKDFDKYYQDLQRTEDIEIANAWSRAIAFALRSGH
jgi:hypothetical protein